MSNNFPTPVNKFQNKKLFSQNVFVRGNYWMSSEEQKAVITVFSLLNPFENNSNDFRISKQSFLKKMNVDLKYGYDLYSKVIPGLMGKLVFSFEEERAEATIVLITYAKWYQKESYFDITINEKIMPLLEDLKNKPFGIIDVSEFNNMTSEYSRILYRRFISYKNLMQNKALKFNTKQLKDLFLLEEDDYVYGGKFERALFEKKTIKTAIEEINQKTKLSVEWKKTKTEDKEVIYEFMFRVKNTQDKTKKIPELIESKVKSNNKEPKTISLEELFGE